MRAIKVKINGANRVLQIETDERLSKALRRAGYKGVKEGCDEGMCGACTVILDGRAVNSCIVRAWQVEGRSVETIEGLGTFDKPHPIQRAMADEGAVQCGFCTPGIILSAVAAMRANPKITEKELWSEMDGNLCRCTGYEKIQAALRKVLAAHKAGEDRT